MNAQLDEDEKRIAWVPSLTRAYGNIAFVALDSIDVKNVDTKNKKTWKNAFLWKNKKRKKSWIKNVVDKLTTSRKRNEKIPQ